MGLRAYLLALSLAGLLNATQATFGHSAPWCAWCTDDPQASDAGYYGYSNGQCRVTMSGLGACVPSPPVSLRRQGVFIEPPPR
jgi:hypothetical protein